jgi:hypothetical protein
MTTKKTHNDFMTGFAYGFTMALSMFQPIIEARLTEHQNLEIEKLRNEVWMLKRELKAMKDAQSLAIAPFGQGALDKPDDTLLMRAFVRETKEELAQLSPDELAQNDDVLRRFTKGVVKSNEQA